MKRTGRRALLASVMTAVGAGALFSHLPRPPAAATVRARISATIAAPGRPLAVFHLGHSLVNRDMPAMLAQLAPKGHRYESQLGWGTTLQAHWGDAPINGYEAANAHPRFRDAHQAVASGAYDAIVLTEMVEIRDAIRYSESPKYLARWARKAIAARPDARLYLYETWHRLDDPDGWLERIDRDRDRYWLARVLGPALAELPASVKFHLIPAGMVLAALVRRVEARGGIGNIKDRTDLFARNADGSVDPIHLNDLGNYLVALTHYAALYHQSPVGLPQSLRRGEGSPATPPTPDAALLMQEIAFEVVQAGGLSGIAR